MLLPHFVSVLTMSMFSSGDRTLPPLDPVALSDLAAREPPLCLVAPSDVAVREPPPLRRPCPRIINGFGPAVRNDEKFAQGFRTHDQPKCTDSSHSGKVGWCRTKSQCRLCLKEEVERIPATATRWQIARYLNALFRSHFCPFCFLKLERSKLHTVSTKYRCKEHRNLTRTSKCPHDMKWQLCMVCLNDPRSATEYCPCGSRMSGVNSWGGCTCPDDLKSLSYGLRFGTNPFIVPTYAGRLQEDLWTSESLAHAALLQMSGEEIPRRTKKPRVAKAAGGSVDV